MTRKVDVALAIDSLSVVEEYIDTFDVRSGRGVEAYRDAVLRARALLDSAAFPLEVKQKVDSVNDKAADVYLAVVKVQQAFAYGLFERCIKGAAFVVIVVLYLVVLYFGLTARDYRLCVYFVPVFFLQRLLLKDSSPLRVVVKCFLRYFRRR